MRTGSWRSRVCGIAAGIAAALVLTGAADPAGFREARAEAAADIAVGVQLEAISDVTLARAELMKGSKVNVTKLLHRQGRLASVDVELADGQVTRVAINKIRSFFRIAE